MSNLSSFGFTPHRGLQWIICRWGKVPHSVFAEQHHWQSNREPFTITDKFLERNRGTFNDSDQSSPRQMRHSRVAHAVAGVRTARNDSNGLLNRSLKGINCWKI